MTISLDLLFDTFEDVGVSVDTEKSDAVSLYEVGFETLRYNSAKRPKFVSWSPMTMSNAIFAHYGRWDVMREIFGKVKNQMTEQRKSVEVTFLDTSEDLEKIFNSVGFDEIPPFKYVRYEAGFRSALYRLQRAVQFLSFKLAESGEIELKRKKLSIVFISASEDDIISLNSSPKRMSDFETLIKECSSVRMYLLFVCPTVKGMSDEFVRMFDFALLFGPEGEAKLRSARERINLEGSYVVKEQQVSMSYANYDRFIRRVYPRKPELTERVKKYNKTLAEEDMGYQKFLESLDDGLDEGMKK